MGRIRILSLLWLCATWTALAAERVSLYEIQYTTDPSGDSPYAGQTLTVGGIVTATFYRGYVIAEDSGPWRAIYVASQIHGPSLGDEIEVTGTVVEYFGLTQLQDVSAFALLASGQEIPSCAVAAQDVAQEMYESVLLEVDDLTVTALFSDGGWLASDATGLLQVGDRCDYMYFPSVGDVLDSVTGILFYTQAAHKVEPRGTADIVGGVIPHFALGGDVVTMNAGLEVFTGAYVEIDGDRIVGITPQPPAGVPVVETDGLIFPGLIDSHNHPRYNVLDLIPFGQLFQDRYEWQATALYDDFGDQFDAILNHGGGYGQLVNLCRFAELRALCAGTTTQQGGNCNTAGDDFHARQGILVNNAERFPSRIWSVTFPLTQGQAYWQDLQGQYWDRFVIHLSEGVNEAALQELYTWQSWGMLDGRTTILHGIPYGPDEWQLLAAAGSHLVWSPMSNVYLYGVSPDIPGALAAGVNVAVAPDWTESGTRDMLAELKFANELNQSLWGGSITPCELALFATRNAARALGAEDRIGQVAAGYQADLMVVPGSPLDPYQALLDAHPADVRLTVVSGRPMYGDEELMGQFPFLDTVEDIAVCGHPKQLAVRVPTLAIQDSDKPTEEVVDELQAAYDAALPRVCEFLDLFGCPASSVGSPAADPASVVRAWPNPSPAGVALAFHARSGGWTSLRIHDVTGGLLRSVIEGPLAPGAQRALWDGRDARGHRVPGGVYWARLESAAGSQAVRILVID